MFGSRFEEDLHYRQDGCICDHVDNEHSELMSSGQLCPNSTREINQWHDQGHFICIFTARTEEERYALLVCLAKHGAKENHLILGKARRREGEAEHHTDDTATRGK